MEIEAKYAISDPAVFDTLLDLRALGTYTLRPTAERHVVDHYLDTADRDLFRAGYACRLRESEADRRELEIELGPSGTLEDLHAVDAELRAFALRPTSASKFERALAILDGRAPTPKPKKKKALGVRADEPMAEAGRKILRFHFERMLSNEDDTRKGEDIEALHHMRVATRRQRAAFRIVSPYFKRKPVEAFRDELRALADRLGAVRDLDVLIESAESYRLSLRREAAAFTPLVEEWRGRRDDARHALLRHLDSDEYRDFTKRYGEFLSSPGAGVKGGGDPTPHPQQVRHVLPAEVWDHYGRVRAYETVMTWASIETIHSLRIEAKRLRYLLEFFAEVLGSGLSGAVESLVRLQDHIGELHDADVTIGLLRDFLMRHAQAAANPAVGDAVGRYLKQTEARLRDLQRTMKKPWRRVAGPRLRGTLARGVARL